MGHHSTLDAGNDSTSSGHQPLGRLHSDRDVKWEVEIKDFFSEQLEHNDSYSLYVFNILGEYLSHMRFLDRQWIEENMDKIFPIDNGGILEGIDLPSNVEYEIMYAESWE